MRLRFDESIGPPEGAFARRVASPPDTDLPLEIAFLASYGVTRTQLDTAAALAQNEGVTADRTLLAYGMVDERTFYQCLAHHLGVRFVEKPVELVNVVQSYPSALYTGLVLFVGEAGVGWLGAPRGQSIAMLLQNGRSHKKLKPNFAVTTPSNLSRWIQEKAKRKIAADASFELLSANNDLCAHAGMNAVQKLMLAIMALSLIASWLIPAVAKLDIWAWIIGLMFLAAISFRLCVSACALGTRSALRRQLPDAQLPAYTVLVALYKEARILKHLVRCLDRIDYPRGKLEIKLIVEEDDFETRHALKALVLAPIYEVIVAPPGEPRTKPRALNIALPMARGELLAVFDAEDEPDPQQLRLAAERFATSPPDVACLQAQLSIDNLTTSWLTRLFAIEYASLFELQNIGLAECHLPFPVSGSSNHFRTSVLREIHGWDAWNVTEDADIGIRLARSGYTVDVLDSTTQEEAPISLEVWLGQRRRWYKGWLQTLITASRSPAALVADLGFAKSGGLALLFLGLLFGPLFWISGNLFAASELMQHGWHAPERLSAICSATIWASVSLLGIGSIYWHALIGMKRRGLMGLWPVLPLLPIYYCLHTIAAWMALVELFRQPFHWQKTEHGLVPNEARWLQIPLLSRFAR